MIRRRRLPKMAVPVAGLSVLLVKAIWTAENTQGTVFDGASFFRSTEVLGEASCGVTEELSGIRINDDNQFAVDSNNTNFTAAVAYL